MVAHDTKAKPNPVKKAIERERKEEAKLHERAVEDTFPASDPPATSQPGSGITGAREPRQKPGSHKG